jgi:membrane protease YdiL (CAAX protease family)
MTTSTSDSTSVPVARSGVPVTPPGPPGTRAAGLEIGLFLLVTFSLTAASTVVALREGVDVRHIADASATGQAAMYLQALWPAVGTLVARLATRTRGPRGGLGFRRVPLRTLLRAWAFAALLTSAPAVLVWGTGLGGFDPTGSAAALGLGTVPGGAVLAAVVVLLVLPLPYLLLALGEDVGWRGLLVTRLAETTGPWGVVMISGAAWAVFHLPLLLWLGGTPAGAPTWWAATMFAVGIVAVGVPLAWMQLRWGIWPGVVAHAVMNAILYHLTDPATVDTGRTGWFATESGLAMAVGATLVALLWWRRAPLLLTAGGGVQAGLRQDRRRRARQEHAA